MQSIIVVEDDINIRELLVYALNNNGFRAVGVQGAQDFFKHLEDGSFSLAILDLMLEGEDGYEILKKIRGSKKYFDLPVIILTAKNNEYDKVKGLDMGADDYITKPFGVLETISRIKAILRRRPESFENPNSILEYRGIYMDLNKREVYVGEEKIDLTYKEFELLYFFMENIGIVLSRDRLVTEVWGFDYSGETRTVDVHIKSLRHKLGDKRDFIRTVRNIGYKLGE